MKSRRLVLVLITSLFPINTPRQLASAAEDGAAVEPFVVAGYLPDYRDYINVNATAIHLTDLMLFSLTPESILVRYYSGDIILPSSPNQNVECCLSSEHFDTARKAKSYKQQYQPTMNIRILVTIGGGGRSNGYRNIVTGSAKVQRQFIKGLVQLW